MFKSLRLYTSIMLTYLFFIIIFYYASLQSIKLRSFNFIVFIVLYYICLYLIGIFFSFCKHFKIIGKMKSINSLKQTKQKKFFF
jgi:hypothetical protein